MSEYKINPDFKRYVDRYARDNKISVEIALQHKLVQEAEAYYKEMRISQG